MKNKVSLFLFLVIFVILAAGCGEETIQEKSYEDFRDTINADDFTGFTYTKTDNEAEKENYIDIIEEIFDREDAQLIFFDEYTTDEETYEKFNEEGSDPDLHISQNKISYFEDGSKISEVEIDDRLLTDEGNDRIADFVNKHKE